MAQDTWLACKDGFHLPLEIFWCTCNAKGQYIEIVPGKGRDESDELLPAFFQIDLPRDECGELLAAFFQKDLRKKRICVNLAEDCSTC